MPDLSIGDLARRAGLRPSAVRYYEAAGLLPEPPRRSGRRCYGGSSVRRLRFIAQARGAGLSIRKIRTWLEAWDAEGSPGPGFRALLGGEIADVDARVRELQRLRARLTQALECDCSSLPSCALL